MINADGEITSFVGVKEDITQRKQAEEKANYLAFHDNLTGLPNRLLFNERLKLTLAQAKRFEESFAVIFLDLDGFKNINDTLGHSAGDMVLKTIAERLKEILREIDTTSRYAGDEFTLLITKICDIKDVVQIAEKMLVNIKKPWKFQNKEYFVTASLGIALYPQDGEGIDELLTHADDAMYCAKELGKNNYKFFTY